MSLLQGPILLSIFSPITNWSIRHLLCLIRCPTYSSFLFLIVIPSSLPDRSNVVPFHYLNICKARSRGFESEMNPNRIFCVFSLTNIPGVNRRAGVTRAIQVQYREEEYGTLSKSSKILSTRTGFCLATSWLNKLKHAEFSNFAEFSLVVLYNAKVRFEIISFQ